MAKGEDPENNKEFLKLGSLNRDKARQSLLDKHQKFEFVLKRMNKPLKISELGIKDYSDTSIAKESNLEVFDAFNKDLYSMVSDIQKRRSIKRDTERMSF